MKWFLMLLVFIGGVVYIVKDRKAEEQKKAEMAQAAKQAEEAQLPARPQKVYQISFSMQTLTTLRALTEDANEKVRYASVELLWQLQDEQVPTIIKRMLQEETEASVKEGLINMLGKDKSKLSLALLAVALDDYDKATRLKAVEAIGNFSNKEAIPVLSKSMSDYDDEVRLKAIEAVNRIRRDIEANKEQQLNEKKTAKPIFTVE